jgi:hypothetical protein
MAGAGFFWHVSWSVDVWEEPAYLECPIQALSLGSSLSTHLVIHVKQNRLEVEISFVLMRAVGRQQSVPHASQLQA